MRFDDLLLEYEILALLANGEGPVGATSLFIQLGSRLGIGQATIGRKLLEMDYGGLTTKRGYQGRVITDRGRTRLEELFREMSRGGHSGPLTQSLNLRTKEKLLEVLDIRLILESETARLAAQKASPEIIQRMEEILARQAEEVKRESPATKLDLNFTIWWPRLLETARWKTSWRLFAGRARCLAWSRPSGRKWGGSSCWSTEISSR